MDELPLTASRPDASHAASRHPAPGASADPVNTSVNQVWLEQALFRLCVIYALWRGY